MTCIPIEYGLGGIHVQPSKLFVIYKENYRKDDASNTLLECGKAIEIMKSNNTIRLSIDTVLKTPVCR